MANKSEVVVFELSESVDSVAAIAASPVSVAAALVRHSD